MANTISAKKALRQSKRKKTHNLFWKRRIRSVVKGISNQLGAKNISTDIIKKEESALYKVADKAAKSKAIHKNKARRIKSRLAKKIAAHENNRTSTNDTAKRSGRKSKS